jgi:hypothetical protein
MIDDAAEGKAKEWAAKDQAMVEGKQIGPEQILGGGINGSYTVKLEDGNKYIWKPMAEEAVRRDGSPIFANLTAKEGYIREAMTYDIARILGAGDLVPPTQVRDGYAPAKQVNSVGATMLFVDGAKVAVAIPGSAKFGGSQTDILRAAAFDTAVGAQDRHQKNWMVASGKLVLIDNGYNFPNDATEAYTGGRNFRSGFVRWATDHNKAVPAEAKNWINKWDDIQSIVDFWNPADREAVLRAMWVRLKGLSMGYWPSYNRE